MLVLNRYYYSERRFGLMVSALDSGSSRPGSIPGRGHCVVFLGKTLNSHGASHPGARFSEVPETFRACKAIFHSCVSRLSAASGTKKLISAALE